MSDLPIFLYGNYVDRHCDKNSSSNSAIADLAWDNQWETQWISSGETDEDADYSCTYEVIFKNAAGGYITQDVDRVCLRNINLKQFKLQYSATEGGAYGDITGTTYTTNAKTDIYISFTKITAAKIRLAMDKTISAGEEKKIGEFIIAQLLYTSTFFMSSYDPVFPEKTERYRLENGKQKSWFEYRKYEAKATFTDIDLTMRDNLRTIKLLDTAFLWYPEPDNHEGYMYEVEWVSSWRFSYAHRSYKGRYDISINIEGT